MRHFVRAATAAAAALALLPLGASAAPPVAEDASRLDLVATVPYVGGTHIEHATIGGRDFVFAATQALRGTAELRVIDVTQPARPRVVAQLPCGRFQGHLQVSADRRTLVLGVDGQARDPLCVKQQGEGFVTIDISDPARPRPVGFAAIVGGSHSTATHPREPVVLNAPEGSPVPDRKPPVLEAWSIRDPRNPKLLSSVQLPGVHSPHDLSFNGDGSLAAVASISAFHIVDTSDLTRPKVVFTGQCPGCQHTHEARFTLDGRTVVVNDEAMLGPYPCPGGALYFYDLPGGDPRAAQLTAAYAAGEVGATAQGTTGFCTPHVFDISADGSTLAASWHEGGLRLLDITKRRGYTVGTRWSSGPEAPRELAAVSAAGADYFSAKMHRGPYVYAVDMHAGLKIFKIRR